MDAKVDGKKGDDTFTPLLTAHTRLIYDRHCMIQLCVYQYIYCPSPVLITVRCRTLIRLQKIMRDFESGHIMCADCQAILL